MHITKLETNLFYSDASIRYYSIEETADGDYHPTENIFPVFQVPERPPLAPVLENIQQALSERYVLKRVNTVYTKRLEGFTRKSNAVEAAQKIARQKSAFFVHPSKPLHMIFKTPRATQPTYVYSTSQKTNKPSETAIYKNISVKQIALNLSRKNAASVLASPLIEKAADISRTALPELYWETSKDTCSWLFVQRTDTGHALLRAFYPVERFEGGDQYSAKDPWKVEALLATTEIFNSSEEAFTTGRSLAKEQGLDLAKHETSIYYLYPLWNQIAITHINPTDLQVTPVYTTYPTIEDAKKRENLKGKSLTLLPRSLLETIDNSPEIGSKKQPRLPTRTEILGAKRKRSTFALAQGHPENPDHLPGFYK